MGGSNTKEVTQSNIDSMLDKYIWFIYDPYEVVYECKKGHTEHRSPNFQIYDRLSNHSLHGTTSRNFTRKHTFKVNNQESSKFINICGTLKNFTIEKKTVVTTTIYVITIQLDNDIYVFDTDEQIGFQVGNYDKRNYDYDT